MAYWLLKYLVFVPGVWLLFRPWIEGKENIPRRGPAILVSNHISAGDTFLLPALIRRRLTFPAKIELFEGRGFKGRAMALFLTAIGQRPMDRSGGRASASGMAEVLQILEEGKLLGIYPEGTRSPDGRLYKGKTGVARLVLQAQVPVIPVGMIHSELVASRIPGVPTMDRPGVRVGKPMDFSQYAGAGNDRDVLRWVTDEIMNAVMELSGQVYVDAYGASMKNAIAAGRTFEPRVLERPGEGNPMPPVPTRAEARR